MCSHTTFEKKKEFNLDKRLKLKPVYLDIINDKNNIPKLRNLVKYLVIDATVA